MRWAGNLARIVDRSSAYMVSLEKPETKRPRRRLWCRWENNIKMVLQEESRESWTGLILFTILAGGRAVVNAIMNFRFP
jgi:hypothetical protein